MKTPEAVNEVLQKRFLNQRDRWLAGGGQWPLAISLGLPPERQVREQLSALRHWLQQWRGCAQSAAQPGILHWCERNWRALGRQQLPERLLFPDARSVAAWCGQLEPWRRALERRAEIQSLWPRADLPALYGPLSELSPADFDGLLQVLDWLQKNPASNLYLRQLPIPGVDSKWVEGHKRLLIQLLGVIDGREYGGDFAAFLGLRREAPRVRLRLLDSQLQQFLGGLEDLEVPAVKLRTLDLPVENAFIVENLASFLAFEPLPSSVVIFGRGFSVTLSSGISWLQRANCFYWGDLDSDGFAILNRIRAHYPTIKSLLMDSDTLVQHRCLCTRDPNAGKRAQLDNLGEIERALCAELSGERLRLEQERIAWPYAWRRITQSLQKNS